MEDERPNREGKTRGTPGEARRGAAVIERIIKQERCEEVLRSCDDSIDYIVIFDFLLLFQNLTCKILKNQNVNVLI